MKKQNSERFYTEDWTGRPRKFYIGLDLAEIDADPFGPMSGIYVIPETMPNGYLPEGLTFGRVPPMGDYDLAKWLLCHGQISWRRAVKITTEKVQEYRAWADMEGIKIS